MLWFHHMSTTRVKDIRRKRWVLSFYRREASPNLFHTISISVRKNIPGPMSTLLVEVWARALMKLLKRKFNWKIFNLTSITSDAKVIIKLIHSSIINNIPKTGTLSNKKNMYNSLVQKKSKVIMKFFIVFFFKHKTRFDYLLCAV